MIPIPKPTLVTKDVYRICISRVGNKEHKTNLTNCTQTVVDASIDFDDKFPKNEVYLIPQTQHFVSTIVGDDLEKVYRNGMLNAKMPGRLIYNQILSSAPDGICPLCSIGAADTLDHYLPKTKYPVFSIAPLNLIPACTPCNKGKLVDFPKSPNDQTLHPYYDSVNNENWIKAKIIQTRPIAFYFYADPPNNWDAKLQNRVKTHFEAFELNKKFSSSANTMYRCLKKKLVDAFNLNPTLLKDELLSFYNSSLALGINSYQAVMFEALYNDDWFCNTGILW